MTVRFAAARRGANAALARHVGPLTPPAPANSDGGGVAIAEMRAALEHFAAHGLSASDRAMAAAQDAHACGDLAERDHWEGILNVLDRRSAERARSGWSR